MNSDVVTEDVVMTFIGSYHRLLTSQSVVFVAMCAPYVWSKIKTVVERKYWYFEEANHRSDEIKTKVFKNNSGRMQQDPRNRAKESNRSRFRQH